MNNLKDGLKISVAQIISISGDMMGNAKLMYRSMQEAKSKGSTLVIFPEVQLSNYDMEMLEKDVEKMVIGVDSDVVKYLMDKCKEQEIAAIIGAAVKYDDGVSNSAIVIGKNGELITVYDKVAIWCGEAHHFTRAGDKLEVVDIDGFKVGLAICYDNGFAEHHRCLAKMGADVIVGLSAFAQGEEEYRYHYYWPLRAIENTVYVVSANAVGDAGSRTHFGKSKIIDPYGKLIVEAPSNECIISATLTKNRIANCRKEHTYLEDIREDLYSKYS